MLHLLRNNAPAGLKTGFGPALRASLRVPLHWSFLSIVPAFFLSGPIARYAPLGTYLPSLLAVTICAWYGGVGAALLAQICSGLAVFLLIVHPASITHTSAAQIYNLLGFVVTGKLLLFLTAYIRWGRDLRRSERTLRLLAEVTNDVVWEWDLASRQISLTGDLHRIFQQSGSTLKTSTAWLRERVHPDEIAPVSEELTRLFKSAHDTWARDCRILQNDGSYATISVRGTVIRDRSGHPAGMIGGFSDITELNSLQERLAFDALHDELTGLPNRRYFREQLHRALSSNAPGAQQPAVLFFDLDRFKAVNDSLGHTVGDYLLRAVSERIQSCLRPGEMAARFGADEFTVLIERVEGVAEALLVADRIQQCISRPCELAGHSYVVTASAGIALANAGSTPEAILQHADVAMYRAKARGRARLEVFESGRDAWRMNLVQLESEIRKGMQNQEFRLYYQPIVRLSNDQLAGAEALLRWQHPVRGLVLPGEFLPIAEESELIVELGNWVFSTACRQLRDWRRSLSVSCKTYVSVNVAQRQLLDPKLSASLLSTLQESALEPDNLVLELTENTVFNSLDEVGARMLECQRLGIKFALDDFGKGHSSLARVHELPISILKVDGSFIEAISQGRPALADASVALALNLGLDVTAEFVETRSQADHLRLAGCTSAQGTHFSAPLNADDFLEWARSHQAQPLSRGASVR